jgi:hypothetical protein
VSSCHWPDKRYGHTEVWCDATMRWYQVQGLPRGIDYAQRQVETFRPETVYEGMLAADKGSIFQRASRYCSASMPH